MKHFPKTPSGFVVLRVSCALFFALAGVFAPPRLAAGKYVLSEAIVQEGKEQEIATPYGFNALRIIPDATSKFHWPYLLYFDRKALNRENTTILVVPNNTGLATSYYPTTEEMTLGNFSVCGWMRALKPDVVYLIPVFLRPKVGNSDLYTHALSRDALTTKIPKLERVDLQLIAMIEDAQAHLKAAHGITTRQKVGIFGFSAAGSFANNFAFLHPDRIKFVVAGGLCALPLIPREEWAGEKLRYPIGICDLDTTVGQKFDLNGCAAVPQFLYHGELDANDALPFRDSYSTEDEKLVLRLFPGDLNARWAQIQKAFEGVCPLIEFHTYPNMGHVDFSNEQMAGEIVRFIKKHL